MGRPRYSLNQTFIYRIASPVLFIPWIWTQFFAAAISWALIALYSVWTWNVTFRFIPMITMGAFFVLAPFQQSQVLVIELMELVWQSILGILDDSVFPIVEDIFYVFQPACWGFNFLVQAMIVMWKIAIYDPIKFLLRIIFPVNPLEPFQNIPLATNAFPLTTMIDTSDSPDWIVGPYGRSAASKSASPGYVPFDPERHHPMLDGSRVVDGSDPVAAAAWKIAKLRSRVPRSSGRNR